MLKGKHVYGTVERRQVGKDPAQPVPTWCEVHAGLLIAALQRVQGAGDLAGEVLAAVHALTLEVVPQVGDVVLVAIQDGGLADAERPAGVVALHAGVAQALPPVAPDQHRRDVVDLVGRLGAGALLRLRHAAPLAPPPAGVEDHHQAQDGEQQGDHPSLRAPTRAGISRGPPPAIPWDTNTPGVRQGGQSKGSGEGSLTTPRACWHREHPVLAKGSQLEPASGWTTFEVATEA